MLSNTTQNFTFQKIPSTPGVQGGFCKGRIANFTTEFSSF
jgi:hypothetical protein